MKRSLITLVLLLASIGIAAPALAHVEKQDNGLYAILHIEPDDTVTAGQSTQLIFYLGSNRAQYHFAVADCQCTAKLSQNDTTIATAPISEGGSATTGQAMVTFPKIGVYTLTVDASSKSHAFPNFTLNYPIRVDQTSAAASQSSHNAIDYTIIGVGVLGVIGISIWQLRQRRRP